MRFLSRSFASFAGIGFIPGAPGTWGSLAALLLIYFFPVSNLLLFAFLILIITWLGAITSHFIEKNESIDDPGWIVIDEVIGMWIAIYSLPRIWIIYLIAFLLFRFFDIKKPWIIDKVQSWSNGWGVMLDDVIAGIAALIINLCLLYLGVYK